MTLDIYCSMHRSHIETVKSNYNIMKSNVYIKDILYIYLYEYFIWYTLPIYTVMSV